MDPGKELPAGSRGAGNTHSLPTSNAASLVATEVDGLSSSTDGQSYLVKPFKSPPSGYGPTTSNYKPLDNDALNHMVTNSNDVWLDSNYFPHIVDMILSYPENWPAVRQVSTAYLAKITPLLFEHIVIRSAELSSSDMWSRYRIRPDPPFPTAFTVTGTTGTQVWPPAFYQGFPEAPIKQPDMVAKLALLEHTHTIDIHFGSDEDDLNWICQTVLCAIETVRLFWCSATALDERRFSQLPPFEPNNLVLFPFDLDGNIFRLNADEIKDSWTIEPIYKSHKIVSNVYMSCEMGPYLTPAWDGNACSFANHTVYYFHDEEDGQRLQIFASLGRRSTTAAASWQHWEAAILEIGCLLVWDVPDRTTLTIVNFPTNPTLPVFPFVATDPKEVFKNLLQLEIRHPDDTENESIELVAQVKFLSKEEYIDKVGRQTFELETVP